MVTRKPSIHMTPHPPVRTVLAPAKLNIRLKVLGRRDDGYHDLVSLMVPVGVFDRLELRLTQQPHIRISCRGLPLQAGDDNLVYRAAHTFLSRTGLKPGLSVALIKNIPIAAGLGGGSSDAAHTLTALNDLHGNPLAFRELAELAVRLGADVPFFLYNRPCIARGIGDVLEPLENWPKFWYVIVVPPFQVSTAWVYSHLNLKLTRGKKDNNMNSLETMPFRIQELLENDLESVTVPCFPVINRIKESLMHASAEGALMSGSGPSVFGIFRDKDKALAAKQHLASQVQAHIFVGAGLDAKDDQRESMTETPGTS